MRDAIVVGSGFGGAMAAHELVGAGLDVVMLERGGWVPRSPQNWGPRGSVDLTPFASWEAPYRVVAGGNGPNLASYSCVGGPSVFFGGVAMRFRAEDFAVDPRIAADSGAAWPFDYAALEPWYARVERLLGVAGETGADPTEPPRSTPYPHAPGRLSAVSRRIASAATALGLAPFRLPLAINHVERDGRPACIGCPTCDTFACAIGAKNDLATTVLPDLLTRGLELRDETVVTRLLTARGRVTGVETYDKRSGRVEVVHAHLVLVAAGALGTPHLLLASELDAANPAGHLVGRHLMRHCNAIVFGIFPGVADSGREFHKQIGVHDFYFGSPDRRAPAGKLGSIQQLPTPPAALVRTEVPGILGPLVDPAVGRVTGLLVMAEDQPRRTNHVRVDWSRRDTYGSPELVIEHRETARDTMARDALVRESRRIMRRAGAPLSYVHPIKTFSHAVGTLRCGDDPTQSVLDPACRFRGIDNLHVVDASFMPTSAGCNPSLTISANALRVGAALARG